MTYHEYREQQRKMAIYHARCAAVRQYRAEHPESRVPDYGAGIAWDINGCSRKRMYCVICREAGPTWCGKYRKTHRASAWEHEHRASVCRARN